MQHISLTLLTVMNVLSLIKQHPLLYADLVNLGICGAALSRAARQISAQLGGDDDNLCFIFSALSAREFVSLVDTGDLARHSNLPPPLAASMVMTMAPWVGQFRLP